MTEIQKPSVLKRFRKFELRRALFILPNAFTMASIFCGIYAILHTVLHSDPEALYHAAMAIFFAGFFDMCDGRVARLTKTQSEFGIEFDSLADIISFGVAPAVIVYRWALWSIGPIGILAAICFASCGAIRLARFNVLARRAGASSGDFFMGLPIPIAASMVVALVIAHFRIFEGMPVTRNALVLGLVITLALLMVSSVSFWTFKNVKFGKKTIYIMFISAIGFFIAGMKFPVSVILVLVIGSYILAGIAREIIHMTKKIHS
ncbi:MAG: CDP-diacylglycerol--serine O-phosphatidyltransferase [Myxococcales bacterium]|nr:CDP-diacylglycerol--serine O-phosphatidyltransferase [Myxococcales bacterium]USN49955.1 MAG: CDP-diacylglycerol--serine O-phosphatidyltransferase [Myxococcales bacterium]